jgi:hypothetical protein
VSALRETLDAHEIMQAAADKSESFSGEDPQQVHEYY